jgi:hypothetical protein
MGMMWKSHARKGVVRGCARAVTLQVAQFVILGCQLLLSDASYVPQLVVLMLQLIDLCCEFIHGASSSGLLRR